MLTTYTPAVGPKAGFVFTLPYVSVQHTAVLHYASSIQNLPRGLGSWVPSGTAALFPQSAELQCTFLLTPNWMKAHGYWVPGTNSSNAALETALIAFVQHVLMGGGGTLVDVPPTGTTHGIGGATITSKTATAWADGDAQTVRRAGGDSCELDVTFLLPSAQWTLSDATLIYAS